MTIALLDAKEIQEMVSESGHFRVAHALFNIGVPFGEAYELIFGRKPREPTNQSDRA